MKTLLFFLLLFFIANNIQAQNYAIEGRFMTGIHRGAFDPIFPKGNFQINGGIFLKKAMNDNWGFTTGLQSRILDENKTYDVYYYGYYSHSSTIQTRYDYIELPINCYYKRKGFYVEGGVNFNYLAKYQFRINDVLQSTKKIDGMIVTSGLNGNIGYEFNLRENIYLNLAVYYDYPVIFSNAFKSSLMNYGLFLGFGYRLKEKLK
jgi:hypothetical protein